MRKVPFFIFSSFISVFLVGTTPFPIPSFDSSIRPGVHSLFLCTYCSFDGGTSRDFFYNIQEKMNAANQGKLIAVGQGAIDESILKRAQGKMPIYTNSLGIRTTLESHRGKPPDDTKKEIKENLLNYFKQLDKSKPITIQIENHGWNGGFSGKGTYPLERSGIVLKPQNNAFDGENELILSHRELGELLEQAGLVGPNAPVLRIIGGHCYGGGIHYLSEKYPNVCTAAFAPNDEPNYTSDNESLAFWNYINQAKGRGQNVSLAESFYAGMSVKNNEYSVSGSLGSIQYVKNILEKNKISSKKLIDQTLIHWEGWMENVSSPIAVCPAPEIPLPITSEQVQTVQNILGKILPPEVMQVNEYQKALGAIQKTGAEDQRLLLEYQKRLKEAQSEWNRLTLEEKATHARDWLDGVSEFSDWITGNFESNKTKDLKAINKKKVTTAQSFEDFKQKNEARILTYLKNRELVSKVEWLHQFAKLVEEGKISQNELKTYQRMVQCESLPMVER